MIKLFSLKQQKKEEESAGGTKGTSKKASAAQLRIQKDINELNLPKTCEIDFSDQDDLLHFRLLICPDEGFYKGGKFVFSFKVGQGYPHDPPKVKCETMVYHPNIDLEGNVCLNILREDWKPVLTIRALKQAVVAARTVKCWPAALRGRCRAPAGSMRPACRRGPSGASGGTRCA